MLQRVIQHCISVLIDGNLVFQWKQDDDQQQLQQSKNQLIKQQQQQEDKQVMFPEQPRPRLSGNINNILTNSDKEDQDLWLISPLEDQHQIHRYNITKKKHIIQHSTVQFQKGFGLCMIRNTCYIAGGHDSNDNVVGRCYRIGISSVTSLSKLIKPRHRLAITALGDNQIIATGGRIHQSIVVSQRYRVDINKWEQIDDMNERRSAHSSCSLRGRYTFVFMGTNGTNDINSIQMFDDKGSQKWKIVVVKDNYDSLIATNCLGSSEVKDGIYLWSKFMNSYKSFFKFELEISDNDQMLDKEATPILGCKEIIYNKKFCNADSTCPIRWSSKDNSIASLEFANKSVWILQNDKWKLVEENQFEYQVAFKD